MSIPVEAVHAQGVHEPPGHSANCCSQPPIGIAAPSHATTGKLTWPPVATLSRIRAAAVATLLIRESGRSVHPNLHSTQSASPHLQLVIHGHRAAPRAHCKDCAPPPHRRTAVQPVPHLGPAARAVQRVAHQRVAHGGHMDPDLVRPPRQDLNLCVRTAQWERARTSTCVRWPGGQAVRVCAERRQRGVRGCKPTHMT